MPDFNDFMITEYEKIADAHFETSKQASTFYNYYLLILAAPAIIGTFIQSDKLAKLIINENNEFTTLRYLIIGLLFGVSLVGLLISFIVVKFQHDATLYARVVNGIRKHFYSTLTIPQAAQALIRVLPIDNKRPDFYSVGYLLFIVLSFAIIDTLLFLACIYVFSKGTIPCSGIWLSVLFFLIHVISYLVKSFYMERKYRK